MNGPAENRQVRLLSTSSDHKPRRKQAKHSQTNRETASQKAEAKDSRVAFRTRQKNARTPGTAWPRPPLHVNEVVPRAGARVEEALAAQHVRRRSAPQHLRYLVARSDPNTKGKPNLGTGRSEYKL